MPIFYLVKRVGVFFLIVWFAATVNFFLPRLGGENPVAQKIMQQAALGGNLHVGMQDMVKEYEEKFGLTKPLWRQYLTYLADMARFDFNYSIASYPRRVSNMILEGLPWTIALLSVTTVLSFVVGNLLGAFQAWPGAPRWLMLLMPPLLALSAVPFFLLGLMLVYVVGFTLQLLPLYGGYTPGAIPQWSLSFALDVLRHAILPSFAIILGSVRRLGARHARHDGDHAWRGLCHLRRGKRSEGPHHLRPLRHTKRDASAGDRTCAHRSVNWYPAPCLSRSCSVIPASARCCSRELRAPTFFLVQGIVFIVILAHRTCDAHPRFDLSASRPAYRLAERMT